MDELGDIPSEWAHLVITTLFIARNYIRMVFAWGYRSLGDTCSGKVFLCALCGVKTSLRSERAKKYGCRIIYVVIILM